MFSLPSTPNRAEQQVTLLLLHCRSSSSNKQSEKRQVLELVHFQPCCVEYQPCW